MTLTALITPFNEDCTIDWDSLQKILENQFNSNIDGLVVLGSTAETATLSMQEQDEVLSFVLQYATDKTKSIWVGVSDNSTQRVLDRIQKYDQLDISGYLIACPHYNKPQQRALVEHFKLCDQTSQKPIILYNIPGRTGVNLEPVTLDQILSSTSHISYIKESSGNLEQISKYQQIIDLKKYKVEILAGDDWAILPFLSLGATGAVSVISNLFPDEVMKLVGAFENNDILASQNLFYNLLPQIHSAFEETNPVCIKNMLFKQGLITTNQVRLPLLRALN